MHHGYVKFYRSLKDSSFYLDSEYVHLWVHLLLSVNHAEKRLKLEKSDKFLTILPGQILTSRKSLTEQTGIHRSKVERILKAFESEQQIEQQTFSKYRVISITKWAEYQCSEHENEQEMGTKRAADEQQMSTNKNEKKEKKEPSALEKEIQGFFDDLWEVYPRKIGKEDARRHYLKTVKTYEDTNRINAAMGAYLAEVKDRDPKYIKHGSAWFNKWQDWEITDAE